MNRTRSKEEMNTEKEVSQAYGRYEQAYERAIYDESKKEERSAAWKEYEEKVNEWKKVQTQF
ncbi:hypothetical protein [Fischerella sp. PCC 9605]|uniref:hypothetical protein n=1 Tax=Fischerella sp. PCC 9605 TaxID=1173024 RepID=UPI00047AF301|nr:hypothetical protein [Fischerella sp. PCC 9605]